MFDGLEEEKGETDDDCHTTVVDLLKCFFSDGTKVDSIIINRIHRLGKYKFGRTRSIIANFQLFGDKLGHLKIEEKPSNWCVY